MEEETIGDKMLKLQKLINTPAWELLGKE